MYTKPQNIGYCFLYNNQNSARAVIGQSAMVYCAGKLMEKSRVSWITVYKQYTGTSFYGAYRGYYMTARGYEFYLRVSSELDISRYLLRNAYFA